jgi:hypothetical protein
VNDSSSQRQFNVVIAGGHGSSSQLSGTPTWSPPAKIAAKYLAPYLHEFDIAAGGAR